MRLSLIAFFKLNLAALSLGGFLFFSGGALADASSSDAIAVRVMANDKNYSAVRWYKEQKFSGAPQNLLVDDYEAVRDGRTVYVNAANINNNNFYTQIYVISYNQAAQPSTVDIFGQLLSHWKFNSNIADLIEKQKIIRDTKRLADLADLKTYLERYKSAKNDYPRLPAGSYIAGSSVSVWPSWQATLAKELGATLPLDPLNKLEPCAAAGYDEKTCWNQAEKKFYFQFDEPNKDKAIAASPVYWYKNGEFNVNLETKTKYENLKKIGGVNFSNLETSLKFDPELHDITAAAGQNFLYQIRVYDPFLTNQNSYDLDWAVENPASTLQINISKTAVSNIAKITGKIQSELTGEFVIKVKVLDKRVSKPLEGSFKITIAAVCDNKAGSHLENGVCVQCPVNNQTTKSVSWSNGKCTATACQNEERNTGYHLENGICAINTDIYFCQKPEGVSGMIRYWDASADEWGDCQITYCRTDIGYHLERDKCVQCQAANATSVKWENNTCKALACKDGYKSDDGLTCAENTVACSTSDKPNSTAVAWDSSSKTCKATGCISDYSVDASGNCAHDLSKSCPVVNAKTNGTSNWTYESATGQWAWGQCADATCDPASDYPKYVANYNNSGAPACVNACGLADNNAEISFNYLPWGKFAIGGTTGVTQTGYAKNLQVDFPDAKNSNLNSNLYNTGTCSYNSSTAYNINNDIKQFQTTAPTPVSRFITADNKCQFAVKSNMPDTTSWPRELCDGSPTGYCYSTTSLVDEDCKNLTFACGSAQCPIKYNVFDKIIYTKIDYTMPDLIWNVRPSDLLAGFSSETLSVSSTCTPNCSNKSCGPDGCGGSCGSCTAGQCDAAGQCIISNDTNTTSNVPANDCTIPGWKNAFCLFSK